MNRSTLKKILVFSVSIACVGIQVACAQELKNPLGDGAAARSIPLLVSHIIRGLLGLTGTGALVMFLYGGFLWMTAQGEDKRIKQGWDTMTWAALGLGVIFGSYAIVEFLFIAILGAATV